mmetsp:Transcript_33553/g.61679  ORF Transcript_33553/g.61679 Transcript_33553/m.61679 type:complete len:244 (+) Transcript_33553:1476-2207(+)
MIPSFTRACRYESTLIGLHWIGFRDPHWYDFHNPRSLRLALITNYGTRLHVFFLRTITDSKAAWCTDTRHDICGITIHCRCLNPDTHHGNMDRIASVNTIPLANINIFASCNRLTMIALNAQKIGPRFVLIFQVDTTIAYMTYNPVTSSLACRRIFTRHSLTWGIHHVLLQVALQRTIHPFLKLALRIGNQPYHHLHNILPHLYFHQRTNLGRKMRLHFIRLIRNQLYSTTALLPHFVHGLAR